MTKRAFAKLLTTVLLATVCTTATAQDMSVFAGGGWFGIEATVIEGNIEGIKFGTFGIKNASSVLDALND